jgi:hypothetical protein
MAWAPQIPHAGGVYDLYLQIQTLAAAKVNVAADRLTGDCPRGVGMLRLKWGSRLL